MAVVLFDLFETLVTETGKKPTRASALGPMLGLKDGEFRAEWKRYRVSVILGKRSFQQALTEIVRSLGGAVDEKAIESACALRITEKAALFQAVDKEIEAMVGELAGQGHSLAVVSNCLAEDVAAWPDWPLSNRFSCTAFSHRVGVAKPDPEMYLGVTRQLGVDPRSAVFIGDGGEDELAGAERVGITSYRAVWFTDYSLESAHVSTRRKLRRCADVLDLLSAA